MRSQETQSRGRSELVEVEDRLRLPPTPASAGQARAFVTAVLTDMGLEELVETARLAVSEVVTNVILHAGTDMELSLRRTGEGVRIDVRDASPVLPVMRHYGGEATTGRGLSMVAVLAAEMGVEAEPPHGKRVWFRLVAPLTGAAAAAADLESGSELLAGDWDLDQLLAELEPEEAVAWDTAAADRQASPRSVSPPPTLRALPVRLWRAAQRHHDAALRELGFHRRLRHPPGQIVDADVRVARQAQSLLAASVDAAVVPDGVAGSGAQPATPAAVDVRLRLPEGTPPTAQLYGTLQDLLDEAEELARSGLLLVRPALPEVVALRDWCCEQIIAQASGVAAAAWSFPEDAAGMAPGAAAGGRASGWDDAQVRRSRRCVLAADDRNRLLAVSGPAAALLGWQPEELVGRRIVTIVPHRLREAHVAGFTSHLVTGDSSLLGRPVTLPVLRSDGTELICQVLIEELRIPPSAPQGAAPQNASTYLAWLQPRPDQA